VINAARSFLPLVVDLPEHPEIVIEPGRLSPDSGRRGICAEHRGRAVTVLRGGLLV
jgi:hypothetical protein